jgi:putative aldouronate transport system substrate-binding protein
MKRKGRVLGILVLIIALLAMTACSNSSNTASTNTASKTADSKSPITFTLYDADPNPNWNNMQDQVGKAITKATGVTLNASFAVGTTDKVGLIASSGQYPDFIIPKGSESKMVDAGAMINLKPLIDKYAPNIKKLIGPYMSRLKYSSSDPSIYFLPTYNAVDQTYFDAGGPFELQNVAVQEAGYPQVKTLQQYEDVIQQYVKKHPTVNGKPTVGLSLLGSDWRFLITVTNPAFEVTGKPDNGEFYIDPKTYQATFHDRMPDEKAYFQWLNHMNAIGLLDPQSFVQTYDQYLAKIASGQVIGLTDQTWDYSSAESTLKANNMENRVYGHFAVTLNSSYKRADFQDTGFAAGWGIGITKSCKDPVRAIKYLDFLASQQGQVLNNWGIKGVDYNVVNGKRVIPAAIQKQKNNDNTTFTRTTGIGMYATFSIHYGDGVKDSTGNYYTTNFPSNVTDNYTASTKDVLSHYNAKTWKELFPSKDQFPVIPWGQAYNINYSSTSDLGVRFTKIDAIAQEDIPKAILAKPSDFNKEWNNFLQDLNNAGVQKMEDEYTQLVKARVNLWTSK